jgi:hypothetical protein
LVEFKQVAQLVADGLETLAAAHVESVLTGQMIPPRRTHMSREHAPCCHASLWPSM